MHCSSYNMYNYFVHVITCTKSQLVHDIYIRRGRRGRDHMVLKFTSTYVIGAYHHWFCGFDPRSGLGVQQSCDEVCQWLAAGEWFSLGLPVSSNNKTDCHNITEILFKVALNTIKQTNKQTTSAFKILSLYRTNLIIFYWTNIF